MYVCVILEAASLQSHYVPVISICILRLTQPAPVIALRQSPVWERKLYTLQSEGRLKFPGSLLDSLDLGVAET